MNPVGIDPQSGSRIPLVRREDLDTDGQKSYDFFTSSAMLRGLHGPAGMAAQPKIGRTVSTAGHLPAAQRGPQ